MVGGVSGALDHRIGRLNGRCSKLGAGSVQGTDTCEIVSSVQHRVWITVQGTDRRGIYCSVQRGRLGTVLGASRHVK